MKKLFSLVSAKGETIIWESIKLIYGNNQITVSGTADIDAIGIRKTDASPYDGTMKEIQIYTTTNADLTANVNTWLAAL